MSSYWPLLLEFTMLGLMFIPSLSKKWAKAFLQQIKMYKKTGAKLREAQLISPDGELMAHDGEEIMALGDLTVSLPQK